MYTIDKSISWDNTIFFKSENGTRYGVQLTETAPGSNLWTFNFKLMSGVPDEKEVFKTMGVLYDVLTEPGGLIEKNNVKELIVFITGQDRDEIDKKTKTFTRWIKSPWSFEVNLEPEISIEGMDYIYPKTSMIHIRKTDVLPEQPKPIENKNTINTIVKFCYNCGLENNNYKFCPGCGTNLQQA